jgi:hypothetical protein
MPAADPPHDPAETPPNVSDREQLLDEELEGTFPASDATSAASVLPMVVTARPSTPPPAE